MTITDVTCEIKPRWNSVGHPFCEVHYKFTRDGRVHHALTRYWYQLPDSPHLRAAEVQSFLKRQALMDKHRHGQESKKA